MATEMRRVSFSVWVLNSLMALAFLLFATRVSAFALLGPYADWMTETNGYRQPGDIGGPMDLSEGYRWNVPVVTYSFDQSFLEYFGSNGVAAVEKAVGIINDLPPASCLDSTAFPLNSRGVNYRASACEFYDLKSATLALLLEQLGLAQPQHNVFTLRQWSDRFLLPYSDEQRLTFEDGLALGLILQRNFGPESF